MPRWRRPEGRVPTGNVARRGGKLTNVDAVLLGVLAALGIGTFAVLALFGRSVTGNSDETTAEGP